jgi:hypothetical protein
MIHQIYYEMTAMTNGHSYMSVTTIQINIQPLYIVYVHQKCLRAQVIHRSDETLKAALSVAGRSVKRRRFLVTRPGDIRNENAE